MSLGRNYWLMEGLLSIFSRLWKFDRTQNSHWPCAFKPELWSTCDHHLSPQTHCHDPPATAAVTVLHVSLDGFGEGDILSQHSSTTGRTRFLICRLPNYTQASVPP